MLRKDNYEDFVCDITNRVKEIIRLMCGMVQERCKGQFSRRVRHMYENVLTYPSYQLHSHSQVNISI